MHISNTDQFITFELSALFPGHGLTLKHTLQSIKGHPKKSQTQQGLSTVQGTPVLHPHGPQVAADTPNPPAEATREISVGQEMSWR